MASNICNVCGGEYILKNGRYVCPYCNAIKPIDATLEEENLLSNAWQKLRLANFDDAEESFTDIKNLYPESHRAYWGLVLSKYGIKYEKDYDGKMIPSCYSTRYESFLKDDNYLKAIKLADKDNKEYYESQAEKIEKIRKEWVEKAQKEKQYDIFISYKDSDEENGIERTQDSFEAYEIYNHLEKLGYRVFYSRETLKNKSGEKYEPYIFNALNTAKVMIVYGSKLDYINSTWVKNEWLRFIKRIRDGEKQQNSIILTYKGINPSKLDPPLSKIQGLDRSSITFLTDLDAYCKRIIEASNKVLPKIKRAKIQKQEKQENNDLKKLEIKELNKTTHSQKEIDRKTIEKRVIGSIEVPKIPIDAENKLKVIFGYLENGYTDKAYKQFCLFLDDNPNNGKALYGKLLSSCKSSNIFEFEKTGISTFSDWQLLDLVLTYNKEDSTKLLQLFANYAISLIKNSEYDKAKEIFSQIYSYDNESITDLREKAYRIAVKNCSNNLEIAKFFFDSYINYENNSDNYINALKQITLFFIDNKDFDNAKKYYEKWERLTDFTYDVNMAYLFISHKTKKLSKILDESIDNKNIDSVDFVIKRMDQGSANKFIQNIIDDIYKRISQKEYNNLTQIITRYLVYDFDNREEKIKILINNVCKNPAENAYTTFEILLTLVDNSQEQYNEYVLFFAENAQKKRQLQLALKLYGLVKTKRSQMCCLENNLGVTTKNPLSANIHKLKDFTLVENVLSLCKTNDEQMSILDTLLLATIKNANKTISKDILEIFDKLITYIPDGYDLPLCGYLLSFANTCKKNKYFEDAIRYYTSYLAYNNKKHEVYWNLLQVRLKCSSDEELSHQTIILSDQIEFENALTIATNLNDNNALKRYMDVEEKQNEYIEAINKKLALKKKRKKTVTITSIVIAIILVLTIIISGIFVGIKVEQNLKFSNNSTGVSVYAGKNFVSDSTLIIPSTYKGKQVTEIKAKAFKNHAEIKKVIIPKTVTLIDDEAFYGCINLETIEYINEVNANNSYDNNEAYFKLSNDIDIYLEKIGNRAFYNCIKLSDFTFNDGLEIIGNEAFFSCSSLTNIEIPTSVKNIGNYVFSGTNINTISIPDSVEHVGNYIFKDCNNLKNIYLSNMKSIPNTWDEGWILGCNSKVNQTNTVFLDYNNSSNFKGSRDIIVGDFYSLPIPKRDGYTFDGWYIGDVRYTDNKGNSIYRFINNEENILFKAKWECYSICTTTNNINAGLYTEYENYNISAGETITLEASTNNGYIWLGWYEGDVKVSEGTSLSYTFIMPAESKTYIAKWILCPFTLEKNINNAGSISTLNEKYVLGEEVTITASTNNGY
nr:leucine-rich repeat protein [Clostridia bacterium]